MVFKELESFTEFGEKGGKKRIKCRKQVNINLQWRDEILWKI